MAKKSRILVADDDHAVRMSLKFLLEKSGYLVDLASNPDEIIAQVKKMTFSTIILDMNYSADNSGIEGLELIRKIRVYRPATPIILVTAWGSVELAVKGIKAGAYDFITKPWSNRILLNTLHTAIELGSHPEICGDQSREELDTRYDFSNIVGNDPNLLTLLERVSMIAGTNAPVLITGESGTGKEEVAEAIHKNSERNSKAFVKVNLGGLPVSLFESEMFGHKKGAFTDAHSDRKGRFDLANGGTIFLDEIGELDQSSQVKLLRVLQEQSFEPLGSSETVDVDIRVICATNRNLPEMVSSGKFREDLYYRINLIHLNVPPLRERPADILALSQYFLTRLSQKYHSAPKTISNTGHKWLMQQAWPGNIRELKNLIERASLLHSQDIIGKNEFVEAVQDSGVDGNKPTDSPKSSRTLEQVEKETIRKTMADCGNNMTRVAAVLGITRATLYRKLQKYQLRDES